MTIRCSLFPDIPITDVISVKYSHSSFWASYTSIKSYKRQQSKFIHCRMFEKFVGELLPELF